MSPGSSFDLRMRVLVLLVLCSSAFAADKSQVLELAKGETVTVKSDTYDAKVPPFFKQSWSFFTAMDSVLYVHCTDIRFRESPECADSAFILEYNGKSKKICTTHYDFQEVATSPTARITFESGKWGSGFVTCDVTSQPKGFEVHTTTTPRYVPYDPYNPHDGPLRHTNLPSEEVDSSEHGSVPGPKRTSCPCGWANKESERIANGVETRKNEFPFMGALSIKYDDGRRFTFCGATIITPYHALCAAHCTVKPVGIGRYVLVIGGHDLRKNDQIQEIDIKQMVNHNYDNRTHDHDISVIVLSEKIQFNQFVGPICLPTRPINLDHKYIKIIGWGMTHHETPSPDNVLRKVNTRVMPLEACKFSFPPQFKMNPPKKICSYAHKRSSCFGDSGGPLAWVDPETNRYTQIGVVSFGSKECANDRPRVAADVGQYLDWIHKAIRDTSPVDDIQTCSKLP